MRWYIAIPVFFVAFVIQTTLIWRIDLWGHSPNLLLCVVCVFSFLYTERFGLYLGVAFGALLDVATSWYFGPQSISFVLAFLISRPFAKVFNHEWFLPQIFIVAIATPVNAFLIWGLYRIAGSPMSIVFTFESLPSLLVMQCALVVPLHFMFVKSVIRHNVDRKSYREILM